MFGGVSPSQTYQTQTIDMEVDMEGMTRQEVHQKVDEVFDELERISNRAKHAHWLQNLMLMVGNNDSITGCVLVRRAGATLRDQPFITWGISPFEQGLHSGHYDLSRMNAYSDWLARVTRGW